MRMQVKVRSKENDDIQWSGLAQMRLQMLRLATVKPEVIL